MFLSLYLLDHPECYRPFDYQLLEVMNLWNAFSQMPEDPLKHTIVS